MHIYQNKLKLPNKSQCIKHENSVFANIMYYLKFATPKTRKHTLFVHRDDAYKKTRKME